MTPIHRILTLACLLLPASPAFSSESDFLSSLSGNWSGSGTVLTRIGGPSINVTCGFVTTAATASLSMNGNCRGLVVVRRAISADLKVNGPRYSGEYIGPSGQPSILSGSRRGDAINLSVRWARVINGDRNANMSIAKMGDDGLRLQTLDKDPASGKALVTSTITLRRD